MSRIYGRILVVMGLTLGQGWASEWLRPEFHGFISQTFLKSTKRDFLIEDSSKGSLHYSEVGINISGKPEVRYGYALQILFREFGEEGNFEPTLDFGFFDARITDQAGVRVGKVRFPLGSQNEYRDVDAGRISLLPDQSIYPESFRPLMINVQGLDLYGHQNLGGYGRADLRVFGGSLDIRDDFFYTLRMRDNFNSPDTEVDGRRMGGAWLGWESPDGNFLVHGSFALLRGSVSLNTTNFGVPVSMDEALSLDVDTFIYGFEYHLDRWQLSGEYNHFQAATQYTKELKAVVSSRIGVPFPLADEIAGGSADSFGWYVKLTYDHPGPWAGALALSDYVADTTRPSSDPSNHREALTFSLRYDISENLLAKAEIHRFDGYGVFKSFATNTSLDRIWTLSALRLTYSF